MTDFHKGLLAVKRADSALLTALNKSGSESFLQQKIPSRKTEAWKYTSLNALTSNEEGYGRLATQFNAEGLKELSEISGLDAQRLVFVNGQFSAELSSEEFSSTENSVNVARFSEANDAQQAIIADLSLIHI